MSPLDTQLIIRKMKLIEDDLDRLGSFSGLSQAEYIKDEAGQLQTERLLERIIGRLIDVNYHILKEKHQTLPPDYFLSFTEMAKKGEVTLTLAQELARSAGLRNILAHEYDTIDPVKVCQAIPLALKQIPAYLEEIRQKLPHSSI